MNIDPEAIKRLAKLSRVKIHESKYKMYAQEVSNIIKILDQLHEVNTEGLDPVVNVCDHKTLLREDVVTDGNHDDAVLSNAPKSKFGYFVVPKVVE